MKLFVSAMLCLLVACGGGSDLLPRVGSALLRVREAYVAGDRALERATRAAELVCKEPPPAVVSACADAIGALAAADRYAEHAHEALAHATRVYNAINGVDDSDAGAP